jgi:hypothetical protein
MTFPWRRWSRPVLPNLGGEGALDHERTPILIVNFSGSNYLQLHLIISSVKYRWKFVNPDIKKKIERLEKKGVC